MRTKIRPDEIVEAALAVTGTNISEVCTDCRSQAVVNARLAIVVVCRQNTHLSYPQISRLVGRMGHSTLRTAFGRFTDSPAKYAELIGRVTKKAGEIRDCRDLGCDMSAAMWRAVA